MHRMLDEGLLRRDLYFRLSTVVVHLPSLRDRVEDIPLLVRGFLSELGNRNGRAVADVSPTAMELLLRHPWPGNVRELRNAIEHAVILAPGTTILPEHLPHSLRSKERPAERSSGLPLCTIDEMERRLIEEALARFPTRTQAAEALGISLRTLYNKIQRYRFADPESGVSAPPEPSSLLGEDVLPFDGMRVVSLEDRRNGHQTGKSHESSGLPG
ncbi:MAG: hypothetical protein DMD79_22030 [Candidatus Rokuibacteriota bacterium]|nr:MAG: hypothetical protein DMD79_22030 [Candidatus Rokubacteria bacterium]